MSWDAGDIIAYLKLNTDDFDENLAEAQRKGDEEDGKQYVAHLTLDKTEHDRVVEEISEVRTGLTKPVTTDIKADAESFDRTAAEVELEKKILERPVEIPIRASGGDKSLAEGLARDIDEAFQKVPRLVEKNAGSESLPALNVGSGLVKALLGQGLDQKELSSALSNLGFTKSEIGKALLDSVEASPAAPGIASGLVAAMLPSNAEFAKALESGIYSLSGGSITDPLSGATPGLYSFLSSERTPFPFASLALGAEGEQLALGTGSYHGLIDAIAHDADGNEFGSTGDSGYSVFDPSLLERFLATVHGDPGGSSSNNGGNQGGAGVGGTIQQIFGNGWSAISSALPFGLNPASFLAALPVAGALGVAGGGALAGTAIGSAGTLMALIPGLLDLEKGIQSNTAKTTYSSSLTDIQQQLDAGLITPKQARADDISALLTYNQTKGTPQSAVLGGAISKLVGAGSSGLAGAEKTVMPDVTKFINALDKAMPAIEKFGNVALRAMSGFFNRIDAGIDSPGFKQFMATMTHDLGPIMKDFGNSIINLGGAFGGFLKAFGGLAAGPIGSWFSRMTGQLDTFMNHLNTKGLGAGMVTTFGLLGRALDPVVGLFGAFVRAATPVGAIVLKMAGWLTQNMLPGITKLLDSKFGPWIIGIGAAVLLATTPFSGWIEVIVEAGLAATYLSRHWTSIWLHMKDVFDDVDRFLTRGLGQLGLLLLGSLAPLAFVALHWKSIWGDMRSDAENVWKFLENDVIHPLAAIFHDSIEVAIDLFTGKWSAAWGAIKLEVKTAWDFLKEIFDKITNGISKILGPLGSVLGDVGKVGGGLAHGLTDAVSWIPHATGGSVMPGQGYLVGEQGPELFTSATAGTIIPNGQWNSSANSRSNVQIYVDARGSTDPIGVQQRATAGIHATLPQLQAALARGSQS